MRFHGRLLGSEYATTDWLELSTSIAMISLP
jgi:hypothetical protein